MKSKEKTLKHYKICNKYATIQKVKTCNLQLLLSEKMTYSLNVLQLSARKHKVLASEGDLHLNPRTRSLSSSD